MRVWRILRVSRTTDSELQSTTGIAVYHSASWQSVWLAETAEQRAGSRRSLHPVSQSAQTFHDLRRWQRDKRLYLHRRYLALAYRRALIAWLKRHLQYWNRPRTYVPGSNRSDQGAL